MQTVRTVALDVGTLAATLAGSALYLWWIVAAVQGSVRRRGPREVSPREVRDWNPDIAAAVLSVSNRADRARLAGGLVRQRRVRNRRQGLIPLLVGVLVGGTTFALLAQHVSLQSPAYISVVLLGGLFAGLVAQVAAMLLVIILYRQALRRDGLAGAAAAVAQMIQYGDEDDSHGSQYALRKRRIESAARVLAAYLHANIPRGDLVDLHPLVGTSDEAWARFKTRALRLATRAYEGEFLGMGEDGNSETLESRWNKRQRAVRLILALSTLGAGLLSLIDKSFG